MPNGILNNSHSKLLTKQQDGLANGVQQTQQQPQQQQQKAAPTILNVAEMLLHGVADNEIIDIWLRSISCAEFVSNFIEAGYDMPTISRITPQDLTAIGITDPTKRLKILTEIKKLNLQDGIPNFKPASLSHWLSLIRLDSYYYKSLCDQQVDTIEKMCQLTWEDYEELGITKLGHQKRFQLAIERMKELEANSKSNSKQMSEPIYDTNPSQILLVASTENHSMNGPIINKQSSTSELSSTGSGSMHSVYSANSIHYQPTYGTIQQQQQPLQKQQQQDLNGQSLVSNQVQNSQQQMQHNQKQQQQPVIYSQPPAQMLPQPPVPPPSNPPKTPVFNSQIQATLQQQQQSHYQTMQQIQESPSIRPIHFGQFNDNNSINGGGRNTMVPLTNRQSLGQLPFALANLPKHQQQLLQQSSIYATLSRQPQKAKQPPPPVPIRTNSLKSNSLTDEVCNTHQPSQVIHQPQMNNLHAISTSSLFRAGNNRTPNRNSQHNSQTMLTKNKSFSGNAHMEAARARFMNKNNRQQFSNLPQQIQTILSNDPNDQNNEHQNQQIYGCNGNVMNGHSPSDSNNLSLYVRQAINDATAQMNLYNNQHSSSGMQQFKQPQAQQLGQRYSIASNCQPTSGLVTGANQLLNRNSEDYDRHSDTNSTKSLILPSSSAVMSPVDDEHRIVDSSSGSSQTLYNSASSGSNDQNLNKLCNFSSTARAATSGSTLNDVSLTLDQQASSNSSQNVGTKMAARNGLGASRGGDCNATTGRDDDFPPPPSPLSLTDSDEHDLGSLNSDSNFADINHRLMAFRVGI